MDVSALPVLSLPTSRKTRLACGLDRAATEAQHSTVVLVRAWKVRTLVESKVSPTGVLALLNRLLLTGAPLRLHPTSG